MISQQPGEGERRAAAGLEPQYRVAAGRIIAALNDNTLEWVRVADPAVGRVDDFVLGTTARVDGFQVKWSRYPGSYTLNDLIRAQDGCSSLVADLVDGWLRLRLQYPELRAVVHLVTNSIASTSTTARMPESTRPPAPYHLAAFMAQAWLPAQAGANIEYTGEWGPVWETLQSACGLDRSAFGLFVQSCCLEFGALAPEPDRDVNAIANLLFRTAGASEHRVELPRKDLLTRLGWHRRYSLWSRHVFPEPEYTYRPIQSSVWALSDRLDRLSSGYVGVFGSPGSGKSTLLSQSLRAMSVRLVPYYVYVPDSQDPIALRGESTAFLHDITLTLQRAGFCSNDRPSDTDRSTVLSLFHQQLRALGHDFMERGTRTVIVVDGLDHIAREQRPDRSLLRDLPLPGALPEGVFLVLGSQTEQLEDLPQHVRTALSCPERRVDLAPLSRTDVRAITCDAISDLDLEECDAIFDLSAGHPLALIYLLQSLVGLNHCERVRQLSSGVHYTGDIAALYAAHWSLIQSDLELVHALGLMARTRGLIPMGVIASTVSDDALMSLKKLSKQYFMEEQDDVWSFFHNSFRVFVQQRTAQTLPGRTSDERALAYHRELAALYDTAPVPWKWDVLYHLYMARDYRTVVHAADADILCEQFEALRPIDAIETDVRLALRAAAQVDDPLSLARLILLAADIEQRKDFVRDCLIPEVLLETGEVRLALAHIRDGRRLRVEPQRALELSVRLQELGYEHEGRHVFELSEPLDLLSGAVIPDDYTRPQNLLELLLAWMDAAIRFRSPEEVLACVNRLRVAPSRGQDHPADSISHAYRNRMIAAGMASSASAGDWCTWQSLLDALDRPSDRADRFHALLESADLLAGVDDACLGRVIEAITSEFSLAELDASLESSLSIRERILLAQLAFCVQGKADVAEAWLRRAGPIPLENPDYHGIHDRFLHSLRFRHARLRYLLGDQSHPAALRDEASAHTSYGPHTTDDDRLLHRQLALAIYTIAWLSTQTLDAPLNSATFLKEVRWILDLLGPGADGWLLGQRMWTGDLRPFALEQIVEAATHHGSQILAALAGEFERRWAPSAEGAHWAIAIRRRLVVALHRSGMSLDWCAARMRDIEQTMLIGLSATDRALEIEKHARAWLALGNDDEAERNIRHIFQSATGLQEKDDYQLVEWVKWLLRANTADPANAKRRIEFMLRLLCRLQDTVSGLPEAAAELIGTVFAWSPRCAAKVAEALLKHEIVTYETAVSCLLSAALEASDPPIAEVTHCLSYIVVPMVSSPEPHIAQQLFAVMPSVLGVDAALTTAMSVTSRVMTYAPSDLRRSWCAGIAKGLSDAGLSAVAIHTPSDLISPMRESTDIDHDLHLIDGRRLKPAEVVALACSVDGLTVLLGQADHEKSRFFDWSVPLCELASGLRSMAAITALESLVDSQADGSTSLAGKLSGVYVALGKRARELDHRQESQLLTEKALAQTRPYGWMRYVDGGSKYAVFREMIQHSVDVGRARLKAELVQDLGSGACSALGVAMNLDEILGLLMPDPPPVAIWGHIHDYLARVTAGYCQSMQSDISRLALKTPASDDSPSRALADFLIAMLDHPSYVVAYAAVGACAALLLENRSAMRDALVEVLHSGSPASERALDVIEAAKLSDAHCIEGLRAHVEPMRRSPNLALRVRAERICADCMDDPLDPLRLNSQLPAIYTLSVPYGGLYSTNVRGRDDSGARVIGDPAYVLRPFDVEVRLLAEAAKLPHGRVLTRMVRLVESGQSAGGWLGVTSREDAARVRELLRKTGLLFSYARPGMSSIRQALGIVCAELYDCGRLDKRHVPMLTSLLANSDPAFALASCQARPSCISHIGGLHPDDDGYVQVPSDWISRAIDSVPALTRTLPDAQVVLAERTRLRYLYTGWPEELRVSAVQSSRALGGEALTGPKLAHLPFHTVLRAQASKYLDHSVDESWLVIAHLGDGYDSPGADWLALNPAIGQAMDWRLVHDGLFRWIDGDGDTMVESLWWTDGPVESYSTNQRVEVGCGWLVVAAETAWQMLNERLQGWIRLAYIERSLGWLGQGGRHAAGDILDVHLAS